MLNIRTGDRRFLVRVTRTITLDNNCRAREIPISWNGGVDMSSL
jgi:hypothetical protein